MILFYVIFLAEFTLLKSAKGPFPLCSYFFVFIVKLFHFVENNQNIIF